MISPSSARLRWRADVIFASHNVDTVRKALGHLERHRARAAEAMTGTLQSLGFAQLMGMADEVSMEVASHLKELIRQRSIVDAGLRLPPITVYKYTTWGTLKECVLYMLRRAEENRDAVERSRFSRKIVALELRRRLIPW